jgi:hypothetical protein
MLPQSQRSAGILLLGGLVAVWAAESSVRADPEETKDKPAIEADKLGVGKYRGLIVSAPNEGGLFRVAAEYPRVRIKPGREKDYERLQLASVKQAGKAVGKTTQAQSRGELTPYNRQGRTFLRAGLPDRREISRALGMGADAATEFDGLNAMAKGLLETVMDTQTVIFHAAPKVQVRVLQPSANAPPDTAPSDGKQPKTQQKEAPLPGYEGALSDLKVGQRVLVKLAPTNNEGKLKGIAPGSVYKRLVELVIAEEEAQPGKSEVRTQTVDALQAGTRWRGQARGAGGDRPVLLTVTKRDGTAFRAEMEVGQGVWVVEGRVENGQLSWRPKDMKQTKEGGGLPAAVKGSISGKEISLDFEAVDSKKMQIRGEIRLQLVEEEKN